MGGRFLTSLLCEVWFKIGMKDFEMEIPNNIIEQVSYSMYIACTLYMNYINFIIVFRVFLSLFFIRLGTFILFDLILEVFDFIYFILEVFAFTYCNPYWYTFILYLLFVCISNYILKSEGGNDFVSEGHSSPHTNIYFVTQKGVATINISSFFSFFFV